MRASPPLRPSVRSTCFSGVLSARKRVCSVELRKPNGTRFTADQPSGCRHGTPARTIVARWSCSRCARLLRHHDCSQRRPCTR